MVYPDGTLYAHVRPSDAADIMHRYKAVQVDHFGLGMTKAFPDHPEESETKYDPDETF